MKNSIIGSYCTGKLINGDGCRQGVAVGEIGDYLILLGQLGEYVVERDVAIVPDENIIFDGVLDFVRQVRKSIAGFKRQDSNF